MPTREEAKQQRRRAIVRAARKLMQETGQTGFSMRALAEKAGVSIATPYNLFGSKQAVMYAVLDADIEHYVERLRRVRADEVEIFFRAVSLAARLYSGEPNFYKAVLFAAYNEGGTEFRSIFGGPRHAMWADMVRNARDAGVIDAAVEINSFAINLGHIFFSCIMEWVNGVLSLEEMEARTHYGFAICLRGVATTEHADRLWEKVMRTQKRVKTIYRRHRKSAPAMAGGCDAGGATGADGGPAAGTTNGADARADARAEDR